MNWFAILLKVLSSMLPALENMVQQTANLLDDIAFRAAKLLLTDEQLQQLIEAWIESLTPNADGKVLVGAEPLEVRLRGDAQIMAIADHIAEKLNIDWEKVFEMLMKYLPLILPIFLNEDEEA